MRLKNKSVTAIVALVLATIIAAVAFFEMRYPIKYYEIICAECEKNGVGVDLVLAVIWTESKFNSQARSSVGAMGLMQLMPATAKWCAEMKNAGFSVEMLCDSQYNITLGVYYLGYLLEKFGDQKTALAAYNAGEGNVIKWLEQDVGVPYIETCKYVDTVMRVQKIYKNKLKFIKNQKNKVLCLT